MSPKTVAALRHLWRGVRTGLAVLALNPAVQSVLNGNKPVAAAMLSAVVAAVVAADSVYEGRKAPADVPPPVPDSGTASLIR